MYVPTLADKHGDSAGDKANGTSGDMNNEDEHGDAVK